MKIRILDIPEEGLTIAAKAEDRWFGRLLQDAYQSDYRQGNAALLSLRVLKTCDNISLTGSAEVNLDPVCHRCLENFGSHLVVPLHVDLAPVPAAGLAEGDEGDLAGDDLNFSFYKGDQIDVGEIVREILVLEIPLRYLCSEFCKGLCPKCGQSLNLAPCACTPAKGDPRLAVLKTLKKQ